MLMRARGIFVAAGVVAIASAGVAMAGQGNEPVAVAPAVVEAPSPAPVTAVEPEARAAFKVLRNVPPAQMPAEAVEQVGSSARYGRNAALARKISTPTGDGWVIPGRGYLCIAIEDPGIGWGTTCLPTAVAAQRGLGIGLTDAAGRSKETLVVPDGKSAAAIDGPVSSVARVASASTRWKRVKVDANGVATARTNAPGSLRVRR
jgi:hypothetical protein